MCKILIAEDDTDLLLLLESVLKKAGHNVACLPQASPIVSHQLEWPDLFILDKNMQIIDGFAVIKFLKINEKTRNIPIIMISAIGEYEKKALDLGVNYFMPKPLDVYKLLQIIDSLISTSDLLSNERV